MKHLLKSLILIAITILFFPSCTKVEIIEYSDSMTKEFYSFGRLVKEEKYIDNMLVSYIKYDPNSTKVLKILEEVYYSKNGEITKEKN